MNTIKVTLILFLAFNIVHSQAANWFGESTVNTVVSIQKKDGDKYKNFGVGFLITDSKNNPSFIVTCAHLVQGSEIYILVTSDSSFVNYMELVGKKGISFYDYFWSLDGINLRLKIKLIRNKTFFVHPNSELDLAVLPIELGTNMPIDSITYNISKTTFVYPKDYGNKNKIFLGNEVYFIGFPFGIGSKDESSPSDIYNTEELSPVLRSGTIAWVSKSRKQFLLDAFSYGGNSGSPIFTKMSFGAVDQNKPYLIGMVTGHLGTHNENFGLARCISIEEILTLISSALKVVQ